MISPDGSHGSALMQTDAVPDSASLRELHGMRRSASTQQQVTPFTLSAAREKLSTPQTESPKAAPRPAPSQSQDLTRSFVEAVNNRDFSSPIWYSAGIGIKVDALDHFPRTTTLAENIRTFQKITTESPDYHLEIISIDVVEEEGGFLAETYLVMNVTGRPRGLVLQSAGRMQWTRYQNDWLLTSFTAPRCSDVD